MNNCLIIESSTDLCLLALQNQGGKIFERRVEGARSHSANMLPFVQSLLLDANMDASELELLAFSAGPGSFTGIRLAASIIKSIAWVHNIPVIALSSLQVLAQSAILQFDNLQAGDSFYLIRDAKMQEAYIASFSVESGADQTPPLLAKPDLSVGQSLEKLEAIKSLDWQALNQGLILCDIPALADQLSEQFSQQLESTFSLSTQTITISAEAVLHLANIANEQGLSVSALEAEPVYLRDSSGWKNIEQQAEFRAAKK